jgi:hypothetical protein
MSHINKVSFGVDPRIELLSAVELLGGWPLMAPHYEYVEKMRNYFSSYSEHHAIKLFKEFDKNFRYDAPVKFMLCLKEPPSFSLSVIPDKEIVQRAHGFDKLEEFRETLIDFYKKADFARFETENRAFYPIIEEKTREKFKVEEIIERFEQYYGVEYSNYAIILSPATTGNYGGQVSVDQKEKIFAVCGVLKIESGMPVFCNSIFHEFSHSVINPITSNLIGTLKNKESLSKLVSDKVDKAYNNHPEAILNETVIRACEIRSNLPKNYGSRDVEMRLRNEEEHGFLYIRPIFKILGEYETHRNKYKTFEDFYPKIVSLLDTMAVSTGRPNKTKV